jgi:PAS domain S-box-containing protein
MLSTSLHLRLVLFFLLLACLGTWFGWRGLESNANEAAEQAVVRVVDARRVLGLAIWGVSLIGFLGVLLHRLYVLPQKQREIERYVRGVESESAKVRALLEGAVDLLLVTDRASGTVRDCNALARDRLGVRDDTVVASLFPPGHREVFEEAVREACDQPGTPIEPREVQVCAADGETFPATPRIVAVKVGEESLVEVTLHDLTRRKELERQLRLHERMGSLGLLTASVAHEINNPLEGIANYLSLAEREGIDEESRARYLERIRHGFDRIRDLTRDLLRFARPAAGVGTADLVQVVERSVEMARYAQVCAELELERIGLDEPVVVAGDAARLEQVLLNLLLNAGRAMEGAGLVTIEVRQEGGDVSLTVRDEGPGVDEADLGRVFDPFFTKSGGTGLGLSIVYGIVQAHGGSLTVTNRPEGGASFEVHLPAGASEVAS